MAVGAVGPRQGGVEAGLRSDVLDRAATEARPRRQGLPAHRRADVRGAGPRVTAQRRLGRVDRVLHVGDQLALVTGDVDAVQTALTVGADLVLAPATVSGLRPGHELHHDRVLMLGQAADGVDHAGLHLGVAARAGGELDTGRNRAAGRVLRAEQAGGDSRKREHAPRMEAARAPGAVASTAIVCDALARAAPDAPISVSAIVSLPPGSVRVISSEVAPAQLASGVPLTVHR